MASPLAWLYVWTFSLGDMPLHTCSVGVPLGYLPFLLIHLLKEGSYPALDQFTAQLFQRLGGSLWGGRLPHFEELKLTSLDPQSPSGFHPRPAKAGATLTSEHPTAMLGHLQGQKLQDFSMLVGREQWA